MIHYTTGDILRDDAEAVVNTVNYVGVMGRGIALQFKNQFPENFKAYVRACKEGIVQPGSMFIYETGEFAGPKFIVNFPTKRHWRGKSRMEDIDSGLAALAEDVARLKIRSIAIPPLGSGLGGLNWAEVKQRIETVFADFEELDVRIYEPAGAPVADQMVHNREVPEMTSGRAALVELMDRYLNGLLDPFGLELLATVHWVAKNEGAQSLEEVKQKTYAWNERKQQFSARQIDVAAKTLAKHRWIEVV